MKKIFAFLFQRFRQWETSAQVALLMALVLLAIVLVALVLGEQEIRQSALIGAIGLILAVQIIFMWGNRNMVTPYTQAQRFYLAGDFESARQVLEATLPSENVNSLTLLGNIYRQLMYLERSEEFLTKALEIQPNHHFPRYGFGRTLHIKGQYSEAAKQIEQSLADGAPAIVKLDLAEARYRQGAEDEARGLLQADVDDSLEPHRLLIRWYMLHRLGVEVSADRHQLSEGLPYWKEMVERFRETPYGRDLAEDVRIMQTLIEEE